MQVPFVQRRRVQWGHTDAAHIAYTVRFVDYAMEAIEGWFRAVLDTDWFELNIDRQLGTPFVHLELDFKAPLTPRHEIDNTVRIERLGRTSLSFLIDGRRSDGVDSYQARFTCCLVDNRSMQSVAFSGEMRQRIQNYINAGGGVAAAITES